MSDTIVWSADTGTARPLRHQGRDMAIGSILRDLESQQSLASKDVLEEQQRSRLSWAEPESGADGVQRLTDH